MTDKNALLAANSAFYEAFATGDVEAMARLWAEDDSISCIHPGWPPIVGRERVVSSWRDILRHAARPRIVCQDAVASIRDKGGLVVCIERIEGVALSAGNHFQLVDGVWRIVYHQAGQIAMIANRSADDERAPSGLVH